LVRPGFLAKKFVSGKRLMYLHPAQFYLFSSIVFFFIFSIASRDTQEKVEKNIQDTFKNEKEIVREVKRVTDSISVKTIQPVPSQIDTTKTNIAAELKNDSTAIIDSTLLDTIPKEQLTENNNTSSKEDDFLAFDFDTSKLDSLYKAGASMDQKLKAIGYNEKQHGWFEKFVAKQVIKFREKQGVGITNAFMDTVPISMFFLIPIFALLLKLLYRKRGRFAHHMVFSFYFFAFVFLSASIIIIANYIITIEIWVNVVLGLSMLIYLFISLRHFYQQGFFKTLIKTSILSFIYLIFVVPFTFVLLWVVSFFLY
jgi:hypothetical protein